MEIDKAIVYAEREGFRGLELDVYRGDATPVVGSSARRLRPRWGLAGEPSQPCAPRDPRVGPRVLRADRRRRLRGRRARLPLQRGSRVPGPARRRRRGAAVARRPRRRARDRPCPAAGVGRVRRRAPGRAGRAGGRRPAGGRGGVLVPGHRPSGARPHCDRHLRGPPRRWSRRRAPRPGPGGEPRAAGPRRRTTVPPAARRRRHLGARRPEHPPRRRPARRGRVGRAGGRARRRPLLRGRRPRAHLRARPRLPAPSRPVCPNESRNPLAPEQIPCLSRAGRFRSGGREAHIPSMERWTKIAETRGRSARRRDLGAAPGGRMDRVDDPAGAVARGQLVRIGPRTFCHRRRTGDVADGRCKPRLLDLGSNAAVAGRSAAALLGFDNFAEGPVELLVPRRGADAPGHGGRAVDQPPSPRST